MNIFFVDPNPIIAAQSLSDQHVIKMTLETAQILSTACHQLGIAPNINGKLYKSTHVNHPSCVWARKSFDHFNWLLKHGIALGEEYSRRYNRVHASQQVFFDILKHLYDIKNSIRFASKGWENPPLAINEEIKPGVIAYNPNGTIDTVSTYRNYYRKHKMQFGSIRVRAATWKKNKPDWL
jgi:hypothetical protein